MEELIVRTKGLTKEFKGVNIVNQVDLKVRKNTVYGLLGPNGAGKSSILKMLTGIWRPTSGMVFYCGRAWNRKDLTSISALIENPPLYENLTARENLRVKTTLLGISEERIEEVLHKVDLIGTGKKKAKEFSLGMKQRLGIALALVNDPQLLILDEPTNGLDPIGIQELRALIRSFAESGITVILSSHILSEVQQVADDIGIITGGILEYQDRIDTKEDLEELFMEIVAKSHKEVY
ncbi:lantibiotic protection ABC transporter ATP-binding protein [Lachnospiraceae bacterium LCP25S3_G4]